MYLVVYEYPRFACDIIAVGPFIAHVSPAGGRGWEEKFSTAGGAGAGRKFQYCICFVTILLCLEMTSRLYLSSIMMKDAIFCVSVQICLRSMRG